MATAKIDKDAINARALELGFTLSAVTPTIRMEIAKMMVQENWLEKIESAPAPK